jgi:hypothetical protein
MRWQVIHEQQPRDSRHVRALGEEYLRRNPRSLA